MKKLLISIVLICSYAILSYSQVIIKPAIGMNFTRLSSDPLSYKETGRFGWQIGGSITLGKEFYLEPGIFWMKNNWKLEDMNTSSAPKLNNDISSLRIPCYLGWNVVNEGDDKRNFHLFAGPSVMIVTKTNTETTGLTADNFNKFIFGVNAGGGLSIGKIFIDCGYEWGLTNIFKDDPNDGKTRGFWLNAGFRLKFI
jgi:hypothetical protein